MFGRLKGVIWMDRSFTVEMGKVYELAQNKFWTIAELGRKAQISLATIYALKAKRRKASTLTVKKLAAALDVSPTDIVEKDN
jgi:DNA-binding Xre family transcriptional regulator